MIAAGERLTPGPAPLSYALREFRGAQLLAYDETGDGRIVEALGDVATADHIAVLVPGNDNYLGNYFDPARPTRPRANGQTLLRTAADVAPGERFAVVVWVGYDTPRGFTEAAFARPARRGAGDLARLTHFLPRSAHVTLVGHSYGTVACGLALAQARVDDVVALGSPGMGVRSPAELRFAGRVWAAQARADWIRFFPRVRLGGVGHGRSPIHPRFGATAFATGTITGHCAYYTEGSESVRNIARIALGRRDEVTLASQPASYRTAAARPAPLEEVRS